MIVKKEMAACLPEQAAVKNRLHEKQYQNSPPLSTLKLGIGELLLFGNKQRGEFWRLFEVLLIQYIELKHLRNRP